MKAYTYHLGTWGETEIPSYTSEDRTYLTSLGYESLPDIEIGGEDDIRITIYPSLSNNGKSFVFFNTLFHWYVILIDDFPSMMQFLREYGPVCSAANTEFQIEELLKIAEKAFHASHGHGYEIACPVCDPNEYRRQLEVRTRRTMPKMPPMPEPEHE